ncbi:MAG TPA: hypothetical protein VI011_16480 [Asanoa sp.]
MRLPKSAGLVALAFALAAAAALIFLTPRHDRGGPPPGPRALQEAWPGRKPVDIPAPLADGPLYSPVLFLDDGASLGTAPSPDGTHLRLLRRAANGDVRQLRRLPIASSPQFAGFAVDGSRVAWAEQSVGRSEMWSVDLATGTPARRLTADAGDVVFVASDYDLVIADGRLRWASVAPGAEAATELRSVPLTGGTMTVQREAGQWAMSRRPWLVSAGGGETGPVALRDPVAKRTLTVDTGGGELATCSPTWCRVLVLGADGPTRIDLMRPDGADRRRVAGGAATPSLIDVAVLERFEVLDDNQQLFLYDLVSRKTVQVGEGIGLVSYRAGTLWWSTGTDETTVWHALDLRTLA